MTTPGYMSQPWGTSTIPAQGDPLPPPLGLPPFEPVAAGPFAGAVLQNGTPTFLSWTAPNDGQIHLVAFYAALEVTVAETGGAVGIGWTQPDGTVLAAGNQLFAAGLAIGPQWNATFRLIAPGSTVTIAQTSALTAGAAKLWTQIWAA